MPGFYGDDMAADALTEQSQVTDDIENFMAHEFVGETQRLFAQDRFAAHDDGILQTSPLNQILLHQRLDILVIDKGPRRRDFGFENCGGNFSGEELAETILRAGLRARNAKLRIRQKDQDRAGLGLNVHWLADFEKAARALLRGEPRLFDQFD